MIWVQGCSLGNPLSHQSSTGTEWAIDELVAWLKSVRSRIEISGVTISGGEPLEQAPELVQLLERVKDQFPDIGLGVFSGYSETELSCGSYLSFLFPLRLPIKSASFGCGFVGC